MLIAAGSQLSLLLLWVGQHETQCCKYLAVRKGQDDEKNINYEGE